jgi:hypothetical protein
MTHSTYTPARQLATDIAQRLAKLCGMFGSDHAGERATAALKADRLVRDQGLTWPDVILPARRSSSASSTADKIAFARQYRRSVHVGARLPLQHQQQAKAIAQATRGARGDRRRGPGGSAMSTFGREADQAAERERRWRRALDEKKIRLSNAIAFVIGTIEDQVIPDADKLRLALSVLRKWRP